METQEVKKEKKYTWVIIFVIVCFIATAIICILDEGEKKSGGNAEKSQFEILKEKATIEDEYIFINEYQNNAKYIKFNNVTENIRTLMLYESGACWVYFNSDKGKSYQGTYKIKNDNLVIYKSTGEIEITFPIIDGGIKSNINGFSFSTEPELNK